MEIIGKGCISGVLNKTDGFRLGIISDCFDKRNEFCLILPFTECKFDNMNTRTAFFLKYTQLKPDKNIPNPKEFGCTNEI